MATSWAYFAPVNTKPYTRQNKTAVLRVRVREATKHIVEDAAQRLEIDQSTLIRLALRSYLKQHLPDAA